MKRALYSLSLGFCLIAQAGIDYEESLAVSQREELKNILASALKNQNMPSVIAAATVDEKVIWARGVGYVDRENNKTPFVQKSLYRWASVSKVATERFAQALDEQGIVDQTKPISTYIDVEEPSFYRRCFKDNSQYQDYLTCTKNYGGHAAIEMIQGFPLCFNPTSLENQELKKENTIYEVKVTDSTKTEGKIIYRLKGGSVKCSAEYKMSHAFVSNKKVTLNNLLNHTSGIQHYGYLGTESEPPTSLMANTTAIKNRKNSGISQMAWAIPYFYPKHPLIFLPGLANSYSTFGYNLAGYTLERAAGKTFENIMEEFTSKMDAPSIQADYLGISPSGPYEKVRNYKKSGDSFTLNDYDTDNSYKLAGGGIMSTIVDAAKFCAAIATPGYVTKNGISSYSHSGAHPERTLSLLVLKTGGNGAKQCLVLMTNTNHGEVDLDDLRKKLEAKLYEFGAWKAPRAN